MVLALVSFVLGLVSFFEGSVGSPSAESLFFLLEAIEVSDSGLLKLGFEANKSICWSDLLLRSHVEDKFELDLVTKNLVRDCY